MKLKDKVAIVTGGSSGIGLAIAKLYAEEGALVIISDINSQDGELAVRQIKGAIFQKCDVSSSKEVDALVAYTVKKFKRLDIMVNNAGIGTLGSILDTNDKIWQDTIGVNLSGVFYGTRAASIAMRDLKINGAIINMTSILGTVGFPGAVSYCSAKGGVTNLTRAAAIDLAPLGIRVNAIAPAFIKTKMTEDVLTDKNFKKMISDNTPLGYVGEPEDIAKAALFLATEDSSYVTGETLHVDGGWTSR